MTAVLTLRVKHLLTTQYGKLAVTALALVGLCAFLLLTSVATPALGISPYAEEPQPEPTTHVTSVSHAATVTVVNDTEAFAAGQTLEDRSVFPLQNASVPVVTVSADSREATVETIELRILYTASSTANAGERFYTDEETVATKKVDGASGTLEAVVDVRSVFETKAELEEEFGNGVTVTPTVESAVTYQYSSVAGRTQTDTVSVDRDITPVGALYSLPGGSEQARHTTGPPATDSASPLLNAAIGVVGGLSVLFLGAVLFVGYRSDPDEFRRRIRAKRYDEWVTEIESYTPRGETNVVQVQTMAGLVNLAIDIRERVLYTPQLEEYIVMDDSTMYKYQPEDSDVDGGSEFFGLGKPDTVLGFGTNRTPVTEPSQNGNPLYGSPDRDSETDGDSDSTAESDT